MAEKRRKNRQKSGSQHAAMVSHVANVYVGFMLSIFLLAIPAGGYQAFGGFKYVLFLAGAQLLLLGAIIAFVEVRLVEGQKLITDNEGWKPGAFEIAALLYFVLTVFSGVLSTYRGVFLGNDRRDGVLTIGLYVATALVLLHNARPKKWMLVLFGGSVCAMCLLGFLQQMGLNPFGLYPQGYDFYDANVYYAGQYWGTVGNVNLCAAVLSVSYGVFLGTYVCENGGRERYALIPLALSVFAIFSLDSEAGMVAVLLGSIVSAPFFAVQLHHLLKLLQALGVAVLAIGLSRIVHFSPAGVHVTIQAMSVALALAGVLLVAGCALVQKMHFFATHQDSKVRRIVCVVCTAILLLALFLVYAVDSFPFSFLNQAHELMHGHWEDGYGSGRLFIWRQVWEKIWEFPLFGGGPDTLGQRGLEGWSRYSEELGKDISASIDVAHNEYLNIWVNQGALALIMYLMMLGKSLITWWRQQDSLAGAVSGAAVLFYCIQALFGISMYIAAPLLWIAAALVNQRPLEKGITGASNR